MDYQQLTPDAETFARVWARVMPDQEGSPIALRPPRPGERPKPPKPPAPEPQGEEELLRALLETLDEGAAGAGELARLTPMARPLVQSLNASLRRARTAWFLLTGGRWQPQRPAPRSREDLRTLLRRQYLWEVELGQQCRELRGQFRGEDLRELAEELERTSRRRRGMIRELLTGR